MQFKIQHFLFVLSLLLCVNVSAQKTKRQVLEAQRIQNQKDQIYINALLSNTKRKEQNLLSDLKDIKLKIKSREKVINSISNEANELGNEIYVNQLEINKNERDLEALKKDYADMIYKSYKSKSQNSRLMFLLSSENFFQAYKRFQYMKQYTSFRKVQADEIKLKTTKIQVLVDTLKNKKSLNQKLLNKKKAEQDSIEKEKNQQENLLSQVKKKEGKYERQIRQFQKEEERIDAQIDKLIREAIVASNRSSETSPKGSSSASATFTLTAEAKELASKFTSNKGQLPWPVEKGFISTYYGKQPHPILKTATIQSNGVRITTDEGSKARAVFDGTVLAIQVMSGNKKAVLIQHGNYISVYKNLEDLKVKTGDNVKTKQEIGTIFTDRVTGHTILGFLLSKNTATEDPATWIYRM